VLAGFIDIARAHAAAADMQPATSRV